MTWSTCDFGIVRPLLPGLCFKFLGCFVSAFVNENLPWRRHFATSLAEYRHKRKKWNRMELALCRIQTQSTECKNSPNDHTTNLDRANGMNKIRFTLKFQQVSHSQESAIIYKQNCHKSPAVSLGLLQTVSAESFTLHPRG